jgi:putative tryptophan/tyrosine transport system substrate-binding protein
VRRREFIAGLGAAAAWPSSVRAQQPAVPVIGYLSAGSPDVFAERLLAFRQGLQEAGFVEGRNVAIEYRWSGDDLERLPALAADLVRRPVAVIAAFGGINGSLAAKAATSMTTTPVVFGTGSDPVAAGLVASLSRPGGHLTGAVVTGVEVLPKRLQLMHELVPTGTIGLLINPTRPNVDRIINPTRPNVDRIEADMRDAARTLGRQIHLLPAGNEREIDAAFATLARLQIGSLIIGNDAYFNSRAKQFGALTLRYRVPTIYQYREFVAAGGLMTYGSAITDIYRIVATYVGRILKGEKPADLPVQQATRIELILNMTTAKALGLSFPPTLLVSANEIIE